MLRWKSSLKPASGGGGGSGTNPGTANLVAAYDFNDASGSGQNDLHTAGPYNLTENGTSAWTTGTPNYYTGATNADYLTSTGLSAAWASSEQDWSMVARFKDTQLNRSPYWGAGSREYITFTSGNGYQGRMGASTPITVNTSVSYAGQWVTVYLEYNSSTNKVTIKVLNENLSATSASFTPSWADSEAIIGGRLGDGGDIDFMYFFSDLLTTDEILWFGDNSSIARSYSDLSGGTIVPNVVTSANSSNTTTTIDCSSIAEGHLMIILVCLWSTREISSYPSSWNLERLGNEGTSGGQSDLYAFSKVAAATETSYDFTVNNILFGDRFSYSLLEIPKTGLGVRNATYSTDGTLGSLYSYSTDTLHLAFCGKADTSATEDVIHPSGYTEIVDRTGSQYNHAIAYKTISGASRALHSGYEFTDPDNTGGTGDNNLSTIHLSISDAGTIISETFEGTGTPVGFTNVILGSGTISFDETTEVLEGSESLKVYSDSNTYTYLDLNHEYDHIVAIFGYKTDAMSNRQDVFFLDDELDFAANQCLNFGSVSGYTKGIAHNYSSILLTLTGTVNDFHYVRVEIDRSGGVLKIARSNDKTFPTSGTNYAENTSAVFNSNFSGTRYIAFGTRNQTKNSWYDDLEITGEI